MLQEALALASQISESGPMGIKAVLAAVCEGTEEGENSEYEEVLKSEDRNETLVAFGRRGGRELRDGDEGCLRKIRRERMGRLLVILGL